MPGPLYFAWSGPNDAWGAGMLREDEQIFAIEIRHTEGDFPTLQIDLRNPRVGLLSAGRNVWCWLSYGSNPLALPIPIFRGRLIGVPENLQDEVVRLQFVARPQDYQAQKAAYAQTLQVPPFWDPVWLKDKVDDPDTALESRPELWHIDRVSLNVTTSDIIRGEDGIVDVTADDHFYDEMTVSYGQTPLRRVNMTGTVTWDQAGGGTVDLTAALVSAFQGAGSPLPSPLICSLTGDGLLNSWPAPGSSLGGGWSMGLDSIVQLADWIKPAFYKKVWADHDVFPVPAALQSATGVIPPNTAPTTWSFPLDWEFPDNAAAAAIIQPFLPFPIKIFAIAIPLTALSVRCTADFAASRKRSETVAFTLDADVQAIVTDPGQDEEATINLSSDAIGSPIDPNNATPLHDPRSPTYFKTARGVQSVEYLLMLARARLLARARCVIIKFATSWDFVVDWISGRWSVRLFDQRLPGGVAEGKITGYVLSYSTDRVGAEVTIACTVGRGGTVIAAAGSPTYASGYVAGYQSMQGNQAAPVPGQVAYLALNNFTVIDDDGVDLFNMVPSTALQVTPAVNLATTANASAGNPKLIGLAVTAGLLPGNTYAIVGPLIPAGASFVFDGGSAGTLSIAPLVTGNTSVTLTAAASNGFTITNGPSDQTVVVDRAAALKMMPDPAAALKAAPTRVCIDLISCSGGAFHTDFPMVVQPMAVPRTIDLEAP